MLVNRVCGGMVLLLRADCISRSKLGMRGLSGLDGWARRAGACLRSTRVWHLAGGRRGRHLVRVRAGGGLRVCLLVRPPLCVGLRGAGLVGRRATPVVVDQLSLRLMRMLGRAWSLFQREGV